MPICTYIKTKNHNTNYYRRNKAHRFNVKCCPHCNYETTGPKSALQAHIWSKHTPENKRPFQCPCCSCDRGFSARANLNKHILKKHKVLMPKRKNKEVLLYQVSLQQSKKICKDIEQRERLKYYKENLVLVAEQLPIIYNNIEITYDKLFYDKGCEKIKLKEYTRNQLLKLYN